MDTLVAGPTAWLVVGIAAVLVGFAKTAIGGMGTVAVSLFAAVIPARESTAALLLVLLVGDLLAVSLYRRDADRRLLAHLVPGVIPGLAIGAVVLAVSGDETLKRGIGAILLLLVVVQLALSLRATSYEPRHWPVPARLGSGVAAGLTTMVANAGGAVMTLYLAGQRVDKRRFLGTTAWFFFCVNLAKVPFSIGLGLMHADMVRMTALLVPCVLLGGLAGRRLVHALHQRAFDLAVLAASALSAVALLVT